MDIEKVLQKYHHVSKEEVEKIHETSYPFFSDGMFEFIVSSLDRRRKKEKKKGRQAIVAGPLLQMLSVHVHVLPDKIDQSYPLTVYGRISAIVGETIAHVLYNRKSDEAEILGSNGTLTLTSPDFSLSPFGNCMPLHNTMIVLDVCVGGKDLHAALCCAEDVTDFGQLKVECVHFEIGTIALHYISMPFAVYADVKVQFFSKRRYKSDEENYSLNVKGKIVARDEENYSLNVKGKIVARYDDCYGGYTSRECILFEKHSNEFERVEIDNRKNMGRMKLGRHWVGLPAYSSLLLDLDLSDFCTDRKILKETVKLPIINEMKSRENFIVDDILVQVCAGWQSPLPQGRRNNEESYMELDDESSGEEESEDEQMKESCFPEASSNMRPPLPVLRAHRTRPFSSPSVQIFSVFIGRDKYEALQVYGSIEVSSYACTFYVFKSEPTDAFGLSEHNKTLPLLDGCGVYDDCNSLKMRLDLKDVDGHMHIKGFVDWGCISLEFGRRWLYKQLCSVVQGEYGFAAIHYSIFPEAVQANVRVSCIPKSGCVDVFPKVFGSLVAQYNNYDYTSRYNKEYYRIVLFQKNQEDPAHPGYGGMIALSRSAVAVPLNSSIVIEANLWIGGIGASEQVFSRSMEFGIGTSNDILMEEPDCSINIYVKWEEVSS